MSSGLLQKLRMMDAAQQTQPRSHTAAPSPSKNSEPFHYVKASFPLSSFCDCRFANSTNLQTIFGVDFPSAIKREDFLFLDTETTGLSGGAGTLAFQIGIGYIQDNSFIVEQFLMRDYHEEPAMLSEVSARCARFPALVTFNGKTFDVPLLKSRFLLNRRPSDCIPTFHADVLFPARRLWKLRLGSCKLSRLEEALLGVTRQDDLEGALVPQTYFKYLRDGNFEPIEGILKHNQQDIVSLAQLFFFLCMQYAKPETIQSGEDLLSLARAHQRGGQSAQAVKCYRLSAKGATRSEAFQALAAHEKRQLHPEKASRLYEVMVKRGDDPALAYEALAKLAEHQQKNIRQALHYTRQALLFLAEPSLYGNGAVQSNRIALQYRYARLLRKQEKENHPHSQEVSE